MSYQNISFDLPQTTVDAVKTAITGINDQLPFLITIGPEERQSLMKLGPKSVDFVQDASLAAVNFPGILPASFNQEEYGKDSSLFKSLSEIKLLLDSLSEKIDNTYMAVGSEAMTASLEVYAYVQTAAPRTPGLQSVAEKLKERFKRNKNNKNNQ